MWRHSKKQSGSCSQQPVLKRSSDNSLRVIGGQWRGRRLPVANLEGLRPTPDHLRETLFNWLMFTVKGARCLDAFAGTGALGTEALSRGAKEVVFLEKSSLAANMLIKNMETLDSTRQSIINTDALYWLNNTPAIPFDIVFLDPPFRKGLIAPTCELLIRQCWITSGSYIYVEAEKEYLTELPYNWRQIKKKTVGQLAVRLFSVA